VKRLKGSEGSVDGRARGLINLLDAQTGLKDWIHSKNFRSNLLTVCSQLTNHNIVNYQNELAFLNLRLFY
jgi:hypothetical protein